MKQQVSIGGTTYEIIGGKTLINGTAYSMKNAKTLVGGTTYGIEFSFRTIIDLGAFVGEYSQFLKCYDALVYLPYTTMPNGWDSCTHIIFDGVMYEVNAELDSYGNVTYTPKETNSALIRIWVIPNSLLVHIYLTDENQHTLKLGIGSQK